MKTFFGLLGLAALAFSLTTTSVQAQTPAAQMSVGSKFVEGTCLEVRAGDNSVAINKCTALPDQALSFDDTTGYLLHDTQCLSAEIKGEPLKIAACADADWQKWNFEANGTLKSDAALCADVLNFRRDPGTPVIAWDCTATDNQKFFLTNVRRQASAATSAPVAINKVTGQATIASYFVQGRCLEAAGAKSEIEINVCSRVAGQGLHFAGGVSGQIVQDGKCLSSIAQGAALALVACASKAEQDWAFAADGTLGNRAGLCADILKFETRNHTTVIAWTCTATDNQKWYPAVAVPAGSFGLGDKVAASLKSAGNVTTLSLLPEWSVFNLTGAGGKAISADEKGRITGGQDSVIVVGGAGVMTVRFVNGLAAPNVKGAVGASLLPKDWSFFSGLSAGTLTVP